MLSKNKESVTILLCQGFGLLKFLAAVTFCACFNYGRTLLCKETEKEVFCVSVLDYVQSVLYLIVWSKLTLGDSGPWIVFQLRCDNKNICREREREREKESSGYLPSLFTAVKMKCSIRLSTLVLLNSVYVCPCLCFSWSVLFIFYLTFFLSNT